MKVSAMKYRQPTDCISYIHLYVSCFTRIQYIGYYNFWSKDCLFQFCN